MRSLEALHSQMQLKSAFILSVMAGFQIADGFVGPTGSFGVPGSAFAPDITRTWRSTVRGTGHAYSRLRCKVDRGDFR